MPGILPLEAEARDQKSKIILDHLVISEPVYVPGDLFSRNNYKRKIHYIGSNPTVQY